MTASALDSIKPVLLVMASTYPRWSGDPEPGFVHELAHRLLDRFQVVVSCPHAPGAAREEKIDGVQIYRYRYAPDLLESLVNDGGIVANLKRSRWKLLLVPLFVFAQAWAAWRLIQRLNPALIHAHWLIPQGLIAATLCVLRRAPTPFVVTSHGADLYALRARPLPALKRWVLSKATAATVVSQKMVGELRRIGADVAKVSVQPMGADLQHRFTPDPAATRSGYELLFVGRLVEKKGLHHLIAALPRIVEEMPAVRLSIVGFGPEGQRLSEEVHALSLIDRVRFLGAVSQAQLPDYYRRAALLVVPFIRAESGDQEGLGLVVVEALGCGCPVLAGRVPSMEDLGVDTVDSADIETLAKAVIGFLQNPDACRRRAEYLRGEYITAFDWDAVAGRYRQILAGAAAVSP